jgi:site-specific recombinase XerD
MREYKDAIRKRIESDSDEDDAVEEVKVVNDQVKLTITQEQVYNLLKKGMSIDKVSKLMGHAAIRETQIYAKIVSSELDKAMDVFND